MAYRVHELQGILDPRTMVHAGPFRASAFDMINAGWEFQRRQNMDRGDEKILARNPKSNMVGICFLPFMHPRGRGDVVPPYLYFGADLIMRMEFYCQIEMPRTALEPLEIGRPVPINSYEHEMVIYEANVDQEDRPQELIIMPEDIPMIMDKIIKAQEPRAKEILADERKRQGLGELQMKAKILTFGKTA